HSWCRPVGCTSRAHLFGSSCPSAASLIIVASPDVSSVPIWCPSFAPPSTLVGCSSGLIQTQRSFLFSQRKPYSHSESFSQMYAPIVSVSELLIEQLTNMLNHTTTLILNVAEFISRAPNPPPLPGPRTGPSFKNRAPAGCLVRVKQENARAEGSTQLVF